MENWEDIPWYLTDQPRTGGNLWEELTLGSTIPPCFCPSFKFLTGPLWPRLCGELKLYNMCLCQVMRHTDAYNFKIYAHFELVQANIISEHDCCLLESIPISFPQLEYGEDPWLASKHLNMSIGQYHFWLFCLDWKVSLLRDPLSWWLRGNMRPCESWPREMATDKELSTPSVPPQAGNWSPQPFRTKCQTPCDLSHSSLQMRT